MEKMKLKNGTTYEICYAVEYEVRIPVANKAEYDLAFDSMTEDNLSKYEILSEGDLSCATYTNKKVKDATFSYVEDGCVATFNLIDVNQTTKRLSNAEAEIEAATAKIDYIAIMTEIEF